MKKYLLFGVMAMIVLLLIAGCGKAESSKSYTFKIETGDSIKISLNTSSGLDLKQENGVFNISKDNKSILDGVFITEDMREEYIAAVRVSEDAVILSDGELFMWLFGDSEYNRIISIEGTDKTYILAGSLVEGEEDIKIVDEVFESLIFTLE